jgi:hypothetical protein
VNADDWIIGYRKAVSRLLEQGGAFVKDTTYPRDDWFLDEPDPTDYDEGNALYGWTETQHGRDFGWGERKCTRIVSWNYDSLRERSLSMFDNTFTSNKEEHGIEMRGTCQCGQYTDRWVRWKGTLSEALSVVLAGEKDS